MEIKTNQTLLDVILADYRGILGKDFIAYRNHCLRVLNYYEFFSGKSAPDFVIIAAAFHDLGIWTSGTLDYLPPSVELAEKYLHANNCLEMTQLVSQIIEYHHKLSTAQSFAPEVEIFRKADIVDFSLGVFNFGVDRKFRKAVNKLLPNAGFHLLLLKLGTLRFFTNPLNLFPMFRK